MGSTTLCSIALLLTVGCHFDGGGPGIFGAPPGSDAYRLGGDGAILDRAIIDRGEAEGGLVDAGPDDALRDGGEGGSPGDGVGDSARDGLSLDSVGDMLTPDTTHDTLSPDTTRDTIAPDATVDSAPPLLYEQDFDDGSWPFDDSGTGTFTTAGGVAEMNVCDTIGHTGLPGESWTDMRVSVRFRADTDCGASQIGLRVRVASLSPCSFYTCVADINSNNLAMTKKNNSCAASAAIASAGTPNLSFGVWYQMEMAAVGSTISCTLSGGGLSAPVRTSYTDPSAIVAGSAGVGGYDIVGVFDDFRVELP